MMRRIMVGFAALSFVLSAHATLPFPGSTVFIPPVAGSGKTTTVMRLPPEAGRVKQMLPINAVAKGLAYIAVGDQYYALCAPKQRRVACAPLVARSLMQDIEIGAHPGADGKPVVTFHIDPATTRTAVVLTSSMNFFLERLARQAAHFDRTASVYTPPIKTPPPMHPGTNPESRGIKPLVIAGGNTGCAYDDFGSYDCAAGDSGLDGTGYPPEAYFEAAAAQEDNPGTPVPSFPPEPNNSNGDSDPCLDAGGNDICQKVVITGQLPDKPTEMDLCIVSPGLSVCTQPLPPAISMDPFDQIPKRPRPMLPKSACEMNAMFCNEGQATPRPPLSDYEKMQAKKAACYAEAIGKSDTCIALHNIKILNEEQYTQCIRDASDFLKGCDQIGNDPA